MKHVIGLILSAILFGQLFIQPVLGQDWVESLDVPLPSGFSEEVEARIVFDTPGGRMIEMLWIGSGPANSVSGFYKASLPQLGWVEKAMEDQEESMILHFEREGEQLHIEIRGEGEDIFLYITVEPAP